MRAGVLLHRDGSPVRTGSAPFTMSKDATELNHALADIYLDALHHAEIEMPAVPLLSEMFYGDASHTEQVEKTIAYLQVNAQEALNERELDALLTVEDTEVDETVRVDEVDKVDSTIEADSNSTGKTEQNASDAEVATKPKRSTSKTSGNTASKTLKPKATKKKAAPTKRKPSKKKATTQESTAPDAAS